MTEDVPYGQGNRMLTVKEVCEWFNLQPRHIYKLVQRSAIPYRKAGQLLRFPEVELEQWSKPAIESIPGSTVGPPIRRSRQRPRQARPEPLPKSLLG